MNPNEIYKAFMEAGTNKAETYYAYGQLDAQTKSLLAQYTLEAKRVQGVSSMTEAKDIALSASSYRLHLESVGKARLAYDLADTKYRATEALFQAQRSLNANERAATHAAP